MDTKLWACADLDGKITTLVRLDADALKTFTEHYKRLGFTVIRDAPEWLRVGEHHYINGEFVIPPHIPRGDKKRTLTGMRERAITQPIAYAGARFDADEKALRNLQIWQTQLAAGTALPEGFVWRDADNVDHPCSAEFLNGLGAAITCRATRVYQKSWALKAQLDAAATPEEVAALDITTDWP